MAVATVSSRAPALKPGHLPDGRAAFAVAEAAVILQTSPRSVYRDIESGAIAALPRRGRLTIARAELERILNAKPGDEGD